MEFVLTLIAAPNTVLADDIVGDVRRALNVLGAETGHPDWLAPEATCDIAFDGLAADQADALARQIVDGLTIDVIAQPTVGRRKRLLLADMDSTTVTSETLDDLAEEAGLKEKIAEITARAMNGELDFEAAVKERVGMLAGLGTDALARTYDQIQLSPGAETMVKTMAANGAHCFLISGGFTYFTERVAARCGFHEHMANAFVMAGDKLTGAVVEPILTKDVKLEMLTKRAAEKGLRLNETATIGDGANDLPMLKAAGLGVAYRGKPSVRAEAPMRLDHADLTGLLYAQGYRATEFIG